MLKKCLLLQLVFSSALNAAPQDDVLYPIVQGLKTGFINREGKVVIAPQFDGQSINEYAKRSFSPGLIPVAKDQKWGYVDSHGVMKIPFQFDRAEPFSEGLAVVRLTHQRNGLYESKAGYVDESGKFRIEAKFDGAWPFSEGLAAVSVGSKYGFIDKTGQFTIPPQFDNVSSFSEGLAAAAEEMTETSDSLSPRPGVEKRPIWGFIDRSGAWKIRPRFSPSIVSRGTGGRK
jgi:hypothetical protein